MRQAFIVKNPKWERFTPVSDEFKSLTGDAVLVVRGRCKEKRLVNGKPKIFKKSAESLAAESSAPQSKTAKEKTK